MSKKKTHDEFVSEMLVINPDILVIGHYNGTKEKILCECKKCGNSWNANPSHLLHGHGCPECAKQIIAKKNKWTHERFLTELNKINQSIIVKGYYKDTNMPIQCKCSICGTEWSPKPCWLISGRGCPNCGKEIAANKHRLSQEEFINRVKKVNPSFTVLGKYLRQKDHIETQCLVCGHIWYPQAGNLLAGYGCPNCNHNNTSFVEQYIYNTFVSILGEGEVISRDKEAIDRELDIYIPKYHFAIEFGTWHWHKDRLINDKEKIKLCRDKGITLITIIDNCPIDFCDEEFWCYYHKIEREDQVLQSLINRLLTVSNLKERNKPIDYEVINSNSREASRKKNNFRFYGASSNSQP